MKRNSPTPNLRCSNRESIVLDIWLSPFYPNSTRLFSLNSNSNPAFFRMGLLTLWITWVSISGWAAVPSPGILLLSSPLPRPDEPERFWGSIAVLELVLYNCDTGKVDARTKPLFLRELNRLGLEGDWVATPSPGWLEIPEIWVVFPSVLSTWLRGLSTFYVYGNNLSNTGSKEPPFCLTIKANRLCRLWGRTIRLKTCFLGEIFSSEPGKEVHCLLKDYTQSHKSCECYHQNNALLPVSLKSTNNEASRAPLKSVIKVSGVRHKNYLSPWSRFNETLVPIRFFFMPFKFRRPGNHCPKCTVFSWWSRLASILYSLSQ